MNMNLFNHNNNNADDYVQLNSCGCWIVRLAKPALKNYPVDKVSKQSGTKAWKHINTKHKAHVMRNWHTIQ